MDDKTCNHAPTSHGASLPAAETFEAFVVGYALSHRFSSPRYYFKLHPPGGLSGCRWIWPGLPDDSIPSESLTFLLDAARAEKRFTLQVSAPIGSYRGEPICRLLEVSTLTA